EVHRDGGEHVVHRQGRRAVAHQARAIAERLLERGAKHEADVLDGVVGVDLDVAGRAYREVEQAVARDGVQHVRQKRHRRRHRVAAGAVDHELEADLGLFGVALDSSGARHASLYQVVTDRTNAVWLGIRRQSFAFWVRWRCWRA